MAAPDATQVDAWKKKCKDLQLKEVEYLTQIEQLEKMKQAEDNERTVNNLVSNKNNRPKSITRQEVVVENDGIE